MKSKLKIIALLPFKNEAHNLSAYMKNILKLADLVIGYDDNSSDNSLKIFKDLGGLPISFALEDNFARGGQYKIRNELLNKGRELGGTHFIVLDADEVFNENFTDILHKQFIFKEDFELKQCLYRMHEFLEGKSSTFAINHTYSITRQGFKDISELPQMWRSNEGFFSSSISTWRRDEVRSMLNTHGVRKFQNLDIWESDFTLSIWRETFKARNPKVHMKRSIPVLILIKLLRLIKHKFNSLMQ